MNENTARTCLVIVVCLLVSVFAELVITPKDVESVVGGSAQFNCSTTDPSKEIQWFHYSLGSSEKNLVYGFDAIKDGNYAGRFSMRKNIVTGEFNLGVIAILGKDAGTYECQDEVGYGNKSQAQLIVLDSKPKCQSDMPDAKVLGKNTCGIDPDVFQLSCSGTFQGNVAPVMQWRKVGESTPIRRGITPENSGNSFTYNLTLRGDQVMDGSTYFCETTKSLPSEQINCVSDVIRIVSPQNNFSMVERKSGENVQCPTIAENSCSYSWTQTNQSGQTKVSTGQGVTLGSSGLYRCEADCRIKSEPCTVIALLVLVVEATSTTGSPQNQTASDAAFKTAFIVVLILLVIFIILFFVFFLRWRKGRSRAPRLEMVPLKEGIIIPDLPANVTYSSNPTRIHTIKTQSGEANDRSIKGTAILNNELFIISQLESEVEVYDCTTLGFRRRWQLNDLMDPDDAAACVRNRCIYISDNKAEGKEIFRIDVDGNIINRWSIGEESGRLSVTDQASVLLSLHDSSRLVEYSSDGLLMRVINLTSHGITHPMHAVRLINGNSVMTQGYLDDPIHRLCEVNSDGKIIRSFGTAKGPGSNQLTNPTYLAVDREGSILVADAGNGRVILIGSNFEFRRELIAKKNGLHIPTRICLDEINGRLYVAEYKRDMRSLLVFNIR